MEVELEEVIKKGLYEGYNEVVGKDIEKSGLKLIFNGIAKYLSNPKCSFPYKIRMVVEREFLRDDCLQVADDMQVELTDEEISELIDEFMNSKEYIEDNSYSVWYDLINNLKGDIEKKD